MKTGVLDKPGFKRVAVITAILSSIILIVRPCLSQEITGSQEFHVGEYVLRLEPDGGFVVDYRKYRIATVASLVFAASDGKTLYGGRRSRFSPTCTVERKNGGVTVVLTDKEEGVVKFFKETLRLTSGEIAVAWEFEPEMDIPIIIGNICLPESAYAGCAYHATFKNGVKDGGLPVERVPKKETILRYNGLVNLDNFFCGTKAGPVAFLLSGANWSLSDSRNAPWAKGYCFWIQEHGKAGMQRIVTVAMRFGDH